MTKTIQKFTTILLTALFVFGGFAVALPTEAAVFNQDPQDFPTLNVKNRNGEVNNQNWGIVAYASQGDTVSFEIYYHNSSNETARNVRVRLDPHNTGESTFHTFTAHVWADNAPSQSGTVTVYLSGAATMQFDKNSVTWRPDQTVSGSRALPSGQSGSALLSFEGLSLGDIAPGWNHQGNVVFNYSVNGTSPNPDPSHLPTATTHDAQNITKSSGTMRGFIDPHGTDTAKYWFAWGTSQYNLSNQTPHYPAYSPAMFEQTSFGLSANTAYYYRIMAQNTAGVTSGDVQSFTTLGETNNQTDEPYVSTDHASGITSNTVTLNGYVHTAYRPNIIRWFEWDTAQYNLTNATPIEQHGTNPSYVSESVNGLTAGTTYYYRIAIQDGNKVTRGSIRSFTTNAIVITAPRLDALTNDAVNVGATSARLDGNALTDGKTPTTGWFEWGGTRALGNKTAVQTLGTGAVLHYTHSLFTLEQDAIYYYRAVVENEHGMRFGAIVPFTTRSTGTPKASLSFSKAVKNIERPNGTDTITFAAPGHPVRFTITVQNDSAEVLKDAIVRDTIPAHLEFAHEEDAEKANGNELREITWHIKEIQPQEDYVITLDTVVTDDTPINSKLLNTATLTLRGVTHTSNETTVIIVKEGDSAFTGIAAAFLSGEINTALLVILLASALGVVAFLTIRHRRKQAAPPSNLPGSSA